MDRHNTGHGLPLPEPAGSAAELHERRHPALVHPLPEPECGDGLLATLAGPTAASESYAVACGNCVGLRQGLCAGEAVLAVLAVAGAYARF